MKAGVAILGETSFSSERRKQMVGAVQGVLPGASSRRCRTHFVRNIPDHSAVVELFLGTVLQECYRPPFQRRGFDRLADLQAVLGDFLQRYNTKRRNHGDVMRAGPACRSWRG